MRCLRSRLFYLMSLILSAAVTFACGSAQHHSFSMTQSNMHEALTQVNASEITHSSFDAILNSIVDLYQDFAKSLGVTLENRSRWDAEDDDAGAGRDRNNPKVWWIDITGAHARRPSMTPDALALVACHEIGHLFGGYPFYDDWSDQSSEGQADYFASQACLRRLWKDAFDTNASRGSHAPTVAKQACDQAWKIPQDRDLCYRIAQAGLQFAMDDAAWREEWNRQHPTSPNEAFIPTPDFATLDRREYAVTSRNHPMPQCRLDTILAGALCTTPSHESLIPGLSAREGQRNSQISEQEAFANSCSRHEGQRPRCWFASQADTHTDSYRIGDVSGKHPVTPSEMDKSPMVARMTQATAMLNGATGFYLGQVNGHHLIATNHHVCPNAASCLGSFASFRQLQIEARVSHFYGAWKDIDLAVLAIDATAAQASQLQAVASHFDFRASITKDQQIMTVGFGIARNPDGAPMINYDDDCRVMSATNDFRQIADPDADNPLDYMVWSLAHGCETSPGDSGSPVIDAATGHVIGIIWTAKSPLGEAAKRSDTLSHAVSTLGDTYVWRELAYAVPAPQIATHLSYYIKSNPDLPDDTKKTLRALLEASPHPRQ